MPRKKKIKKKKKFGIIFICITALLAVTAAVQYIINAHRDDAHFVLYKDFGIDMPENFPLHGIDVSSYQEKIDWPKVAAMQSQNIKINFVFMKATEGLTGVDNTFKYNWENAHRTGIVCGAYHYFIASKSGTLQAVNFIKNVRLSKGDLLPVADVEELYNTSPQIMRNELSAFLNTLENFYHVKPIIYSSASFYSDYLKDDFDDYPLWAAHYFEERKPRVHRHWDFWQHNESGRVYGIAPYTDFNVFNGDSIAFKNFLMK